MNELVTFQDRWSAPPQVGILGTYWIWRGDRLVIATARTEVIQRYTGASKPGVVHMVSSSAQMVCRIIDLRDEEVTTSKTALDAIKDAIRSAYNAHPACLLSFAPGEDRLTEQRRRLVEWLRQTWHPEDISPGVVGHYAVHEQMGVTFPEYSNPPRCGSHPYQSGG